MQNNQYDLIVIGGGSGGVRAGRFAANAGLKVAIIEGARWGGTCVNVGCVPKKLYAHASHYAEAFDDARSFGWQVSVHAQNWAQLKAGTDRYIKRLNGIYEKLLRNAGVDLYEGIGSFRDASTVEVNGTHLTGKSIMIATGSRPTKPDIIGQELAMTSNEFFALNQRPERVLVVGGGYIGLEIASILNGVGSRVTLVHRSSLVLRGFDEDIRERMTKNVESNGIELVLDCTVEAIHPTEQARLVQFSNGKTEVFDAVIFATGRMPNTQNLMIEQAGIALQADGSIAVDHTYRSCVSHIFAVGDVINRRQLTPVALAEAMQVVSHITGQPRAPIDYDLIPSAVFSQPNVATVGLTEGQARERGYKLQVFEADFRALHHSLPDRSDRTYMKTIVDDTSNRVLGCHMIGEHAGEQIQGLAVALQAGATKAQFDATIGIHPTMAEEWVTMRKSRDL